MSRRSLPTLLALALALALGAPGAALAAKRPARPASQLYVVLGDSYGAGVQATGPGVGAPTAHGYANQLPALAARRGYRLRLTNFACAGATVSSISHQAGCAPQNRAPGGPRYTTSQSSAAQAYIRAHRASIGLITITLSADDLSSCYGSGGVQDTPVQDVIACVTTLVPKLSSGVGAFAKAVRRAAGPKVPIIGITYPDSLLGAFVTGNPTLAQASVDGFHYVVNPALAKAYESADARVVDATAGTGAYGSLQDTTTLAPFGVIPKKVATICQLTFYCAMEEIHPNTSGYQAMAKLVAAALSRRR
jgi:lysophospholipase L1-like esterase